MKFTFQNYKTTLKRFKVMGKIVFMRCVCSGRFGSIESTPYCWIAGRFDRYLHMTHSDAARSSGLIFSATLHYSRWHGRYWKQRNKLVVWRWFTT